MWCVLFGKNEPNKHSPFADDNRPSHERPSRRNTIDALVNATAESTPALLSPPPTPRGRSKSPAASFKNLFSKKKKWNFTRQLKKCNQKEWTRSQWNYDRHQTESETAMTIRQTNLVDLSVTSALNWNHYDCQKDGQGSVAVRPLSKWKWKCSCRCVNCRVANVPKSLLTPWNRSGGRHGDCACVHMSPVHGAKCPQSK